VQRQLRATTTQIPQGYIDGRERKRRDRADRRGVGVKQEVTPQRLDVFGIATDEARRQVIPKQRDDGRAARADRVAVAGADGTAATMAVEVRLISTCRTWSSWLASRVRRRSFPRCPPSEQ